MRNRSAVIFICGMLVAATVSAQADGDGSALGEHPPAAASESAAGLLAQRVADNADTQHQVESWQAAVSQFWRTAHDYLDRELIVIGDQVVRATELIWAAAVFCLVMMIAGVGRMVVRRMLRHLRERADATETVFDDSMLAVIEQTKRLFFLLVAAYVALITLPLPESARNVLNSMAIVVFTIQVALWGNAMLIEVINRTQKRRVATDPSAASAFGLISFFSRVAVWSAALLLVLTNLGYEIGPLLAGLGVGGVAVAFAMQSILGDIFCSIAIVLDKPFVVGDFIIVGDLMGNVESIGIKTTRIRSLSGEQIIFSNADLISSRVRNYKRMFERRIPFTFGVVYETPLEQLKKIPVIVQAIINELERVRFDRAHFKEYGDFSLDFEVVYYVLVPDYNQYMDIQQEINLRLYKAFQEESIAFAYPTREIILRPSATADNSGS